MVWPNEALLTLRMVHIASAVLLVGGVFFNHFILRPTLERIPPPQQAVVATRIGHLFVYLAWGTLALLITSGLLRLLSLWYLDDLFRPGFWTEKYGRWLAVMMAGWTVLAVDAAILTFIFRPILLRRLSLNPRPNPAAMQDRRDTQVRVAKWVDRLILINLLAGTVGIVAGASLLYGGII